MPNEIKNWVIVCQCCKTVHKYRGLYLHHGICTCGSNDFFYRTEEQYNYFIRYELREEKLKRILNG